MLPLHRRSCCSNAFISRLTIARVRLCVYHTRDETAYESAPLYVSSSFFTTSFGWSEYSSAKHKSGGERREHDTFTSFITSFITRNKPVNLFHLLCLISGWRNRIKLHKQRCEPVREWETALPQIRRGISMHDLAQAGFQAF